MPNDALDLKVSNSRKVYLGTVAVVPRADLKRHFELPMPHGTPDAALQSHLEAIVSLPKVPDLAKVNASDCALDVFVAQHQGGAAFDGTVGDIWVPFFWRPSVEVTSRLYAVKGRKPIATVTVKKRMPWSEYLTRMFSLKHALSFSSPFTHEDMIELLDEALLETMGKVRTSL